MVLLDNGGGAVRGSVLLGLPPPDLRGLVEHVSVQSHPHGVLEWRVVPDLSPHLLVAIVDGARGRRADAFVVGARSRSVAVGVNRRIVTVAVRLRPGALPSLLSMPASALTDRSVRLVDAFAGHDLRNHEIAGDAPPGLVANELLRIIRRAARRPDADPIGGALECAHRVGTMAAAFGAAERTLRDRVVREIGLPPKRALSIARLHRALFHAQGHERSWAEVAYAAGYADQAHLARECRALLGDSPSGWLARRSADSFKTGVTTSR
jgi:AraC-like DNA-binding protein